MKILVATDGSDFSRKAVETACDLLAGNNDEHHIKIISAYDPFIYVGPEPFTISAEYIEEMAKIGREQAKKIADEAEKTVLSRFTGSGDQVTMHVVTNSPGKAIIEEAERWHADLIVVGSHGRGFWGRTLLGSTSDSVLHHAPCSVLVVRKKQDVKGGANTSRNGAEN